MKNDHLPLDLEALQKKLDAEGVEKIKQFAATNDWLARWREDALKSEIEQMRDDPRFRRVAEATDAAIKALAGWQEVRARGETSAARYWQREVAPYLARLQKGPESRYIRELYREGDLGRGGWEQEFAARLNGRDPKRREYSIRFDEFGAREFRDIDDPTPTDPVSPQEDETGVIQQSLEVPINICRPSPFEILAVGKADTGIAINASSTGGSVAGDGGAQAKTLSLVVMGGGAYATSQIGSTFSLPPGYETLTCTATLDITYTGFSFALIGGSTASVTAVIRVLLDDGTDFTVRQQFAAIPSPVICYRETNREIRGHEMTVSDIALNGRSGPVRVFAGIEVYSAAAGIVGSATAGMTATFNLAQLCFHAR